MNFSPRVSSYIGLLLLALILLFGIVAKIQQEREAARVSLALYEAQQRQKIADLKFYGTVKQALAVAVPSIVLISGAFVAVGIARRKQIVFVNIGKHSAFPVHYRQIQRGELAQQFAALCTAEELKQSNAGLEKAFQIYSALAETQAKILRATPARAAAPASRKRIFEATP